MNGRKIALTKKSTLPYYVTAAVFAALTLIFRPYSVIHFIIIGALCVGVWFLCRKLAKDVTIYKDRPSSGVPEYDEAIDSLYGASALFENTAPLFFSRSSEAANYLLSMKASVDSMITNLTAHPEDYKIARKFITLYLPMVVKMINSYREMYKQGNRGENINASLSAIEGSLVSIDDAFKRQLDAQFANDNLDVTTDIEVLGALMNGTMPGSVHVPEENKTDNE